MQKNVPFCSNNGHADGFRKFCSHCSAKSPPADLLPTNLFLEPSPAIDFHVVTIDQSDGLDGLLSVVDAHPPAHKLPQIRHCRLGSRASAQDLCRAADRYEFDIFDHERPVHQSSLAPGCRRGTIPGPSRPGSTSGEPRGGPQLGEFQMRMDQGAGDHRSLASA